MLSDIATDASSAVTMDPIVIVAYSDTHNKHHEMDFPSADILIHAGDLSEAGTIQELTAAIEHIGTAKYLHKIVIGGNHDISLDPTCTYRSARARLWGTLATPEQYDELLSRMKELGIIYMSPQTTQVCNVEVRGRSLKIYGNPAVPARTGPFAFYNPPELDVFSDMPEDTAIVVSHSPPQGVLDTVGQATNSVRSIGCASFRKAVERIRPRLVIFGHVHENRGREVWQSSDGRTEFINAARKGNEGAGILAIV